MNLEKSLTWEWLQNGDKITLRFYGTLSRDTLFPLWQQRAIFFVPAEKYANLEWDFAQMARIDSAGFALLCDFVQYAQQHSPQIKHQKFIHYSDQLLTLADLYGLSDWIRQFI